MTIEIGLLANPVYLELPQGLVGWLGFLILLGGILLVLYRSQSYRKRWQGFQWGILLVLMVMIPLTSLFLVLRFPVGGGLPPPGRPVDLPGPALVVFSALPWVLAAGLLGPISAAALGFISGLLLAFWDTHNLITPLEISLLASLLGIALHQRYRTFFYRALRQPLITTFLLALIYPILYLLDTLFMTGGTLANRLDYGLTHVTSAWLVVGGELLIAGLFAEGVAVFYPKVWGDNGTLKPTPAERRLYIRLLVSMSPLAWVLILTLLIGDWIVAGNAAQQMLYDRMSSTAQMASETVPFFLETGQSLIQTFAKDQRLYTSPPDKVRDILQQDLQTVPFFRQISLLDIQKQLISGYPDSNSRYTLSSEENSGVELALNGVAAQYYTDRPPQGESAAQVSFLASLTDSNGQVHGVLIGQSDLVTNPFTQPVLSSLKNIAGVDGEGLLLDDNGRILFNSTGARIMEAYSGRKADGAIFYHDTAPDGTRRLVYYQPTLGNPWAVVLTVPARRAQQMALNIGAPLLVMILALSFIAAILLRYGVKVVTGSLRNLALEANRITSGELDHALTVTGEDEVGQLRRAFEQMRVSLKDRLDELKRLLLVSQGVASSLDMKEAVQPVLDSALAMGACAVRVVMDPTALPEIGGNTTPPSRFGAGTLNDTYTSLDNQILELTRQQDRVMLSNFSRVRLLTITPGIPRPEAIIALALRDENTYYGTLYLVYDTPHQFTEDEVRFLTTLAGQSALAAANTRLFLNAEIGRQRLAAILASTPDPVLVTDHNNRLLLSNPAAWHVLGVGVEAGEGQPIDKLISHKELVSLLRSSTDDRQSVEIILPDGRVFLATASQVQADSHSVGRVCVLRDVTHFKELDSLKSEFVATVSHDLRSPLTLMRGYATMLEMVGNLNEQQSGYINKILSSVETMSRLVNNLLDLGRIEAGMALQLEMVSAKDVIERVISTLQLQASQKHIQINTDIPTNMSLTVEADPALLQQAIQNLVENAIKYTENGGSVNVRIQTRQDRLVFEISDTGIGISPVDQQRLFEKFYRGGRKEARKQHGSGLGLAIVKSIAGRHGGDVWVESQLGKGSAFYFTIPLHQPKHESPRHNE